MHLLNCNLYLWNVLYDILSVSVLSADLYCVIQRNIEHIRLLFAAIVFKHSRYITSSTLVLDMKVSSTVVH